MRAKREGTRLGSGGKEYEDAMRRLSIHSSSTASSLLSDNSHSELLSSCSHSEPDRLLPSPGFGHNRNNSGDGCDGADGHQSACFQPDSVCEFSDYSQPVQDDLRSRGTDGKEAVDTTVFDAVFHGALQEHVSEGREKSVHGGGKEDPLWSELSYGSDKKKNNTALNAVRV